MGEWDEVEERGSCQECPGVGKRDWGQEWREGSALAGGPGTSSRAAGEKAQCMVRATRRLVNLCWDRIELLFGVFEFSQQNRDQGYQLRGWMEKEVLQY